MVIVRIHREICPVKSGIPSLNGQGNSVHGNGPHYIQYSLQFEIMVKTWWK